MNKFCKDSISVVVLFLAAALVAVPALVAQTDPGPRPVGSQNFTASGPVTVTSTNTTGTPLLTTGILDFHQPADANGNEGAGNPIRQPDPEAAFWGNTIAIFGETVSVNGGEDTSINPFTGKPNDNPTLTGLGPAFNGNSCFMCHSQPAIGGSSPGTGTPGFSQNPQLTVAHTLGATNSETLSFLTANGPIREARFILNENDSTKKELDGGVHELFTIQGRSDAPSNCSLSQPDFTTQIANNNVIFRIPIPVFGEGLVENVSDADFTANAGLESFNASGIATGIQNAVLNSSPNDGTVSKFGWKAQNKSVLLFSGEAANVEMGMTNELFTNEKVPGTNCATNNLPEDNTRITFGTGKTAADTDALVSSAVESFAVFMRLNGAPGQCDFASGTNSTTGAAQCNALGTSATNGLQVFNQVGCNLCHTQSFTTQPSNIGGLSNRTFEPFSDFGLHHMGATLADGVTQGAAGPDMFRTAPLWGIGQRFFFMHDGRATNLLQAIAAHESSSSICFDTSSTQSFTVQFATTTGASVAFSPSATTHSCGSEANSVVANFNNLSTSDKQDLLNFLRSL